MVLVLDLGISNVVSIERMIKKVGYLDVKVSNSKDDLSNCKKIILPGVGHYDAGVKALSRLDLINFLPELIMRKNISTLGICLGAQLLLSHSEEGESLGLGLVDGHCKKFNKKLIGNFKIPNMGWLDTIFTKKSELIAGLKNESRFYFVHSYHFDLINQGDQLCYSNYGYDFSSGFQNKNIFGVQFHPEKSHKYGMAIMRNFLKIDNEKN